MKKSLLSENMKKNMILLMVVLVTGAQMAVSQPYTGDGGKGMRLAVLELESKGLSEDEQWMLSLVQGSITGDFNKFSAITIIDRQNLEKIFAEWKEGFSGRYSEQDRIRIGNLTNASHILTGSISKTANAFVLELNVTDVTSGERKASYSPTPVSSLALENLSAVKEASADLLKQLGVNLTSEALGELKRVANTARMQAEAALARGIAAQKKGTDVAALSYFFQAAAFDSSLFEAANRSTVISANISSGNIGADVRNDIVWRRSWVNRLTETEVTFHSIISSADPPYTLFYATNIQTGNINYQKETANLSISINLSANKTWFKAMERSLQAAQSVLNGLNTTNMKDKWGLANWPWSGVSNTNPFASSKQYNITVLFELVNEEGRVIGNQTVRLNPYFSINRNFSIGFTENAHNTVTFNAVSADDISDNLTIRIASVSGAPPQNARFAITAMSGEERQQNIFLQVDNGIVRGFNPSLTAEQRAQYRNLVIPREAWDKPITAIADKAFINCQLTSVTIPSSVTSIGNQAFANNQITRVTIPSSVSSIGSQAFANNQLRSLTIPNGVISMASDAFFGNSKISMSIPKDFTIMDSRDGQKYRIVNIGDNTWMAENLNYETSNSWCYGNSNSNCSKYGRLYDWNTAMNACPAGWRLPTDGHWDNLINAVGGKNVAGERLKSKTGWEAHSKHIGTDEFGFTALPGGSYCPSCGPSSFSDFAKGINRQFLRAGSDGDWWTARELLKDGVSSGYRMIMRSNGSNVVTYSTVLKNRGLSVRCVQE